MITTMIGVFFHIDVAFKSMSIVSTNSFLAVPSTQNHIALISLSGRSSFALALHHFCTSRTALYFLRIVGSKPIVSISRKFTFFDSYTVIVGVVPVVPHPVLATSSPNTELINVDLPTPELPSTRTLPFSLLITSPRFFCLSYYTTSILPIIGVVEITR